MANLRFRDDGTYTIAQITDTHFSDRPHNPETYALCDLVIRLDSPDLVVLSGDIVHPAWSADPLVHWRDVVAFFDGYAIPWMFVYGNHDPEGLPHDSIDEVLATSRHCLYERGPEDLFGRGNYVVPIRTPDDRIGALVWSLDSGMGAEGVPSGYDWVKEDQIAWFRREADRLMEGTGERITGLAFIHTPLQQHVTVWQTQRCSGYMYEKVCVQGKDVGLFRAFCKRRRIRACFVGHDHVNDYEGSLDGVDLCYGRGSGYNCYGRDGYRKGARIIRLEAGARGYRSYIRLDDGSLAERPPHEPDGTAVGFP